MIRANLDVVSTICGRIFAERSAAALAAAALAVAGLLATASAEDVTFPKPKYITTNGIRMAVYEQGEGIPVVFCHGFPELAYSWRHQLPALAKAGYHVGYMAKGWAPGNVKAGGHTGNPAGKSYKTFQHFFDAEG